MVSHRDIQDRLDDYADGVLSERERREVARHVDGCARCREELARLQQLLARAKDLPKTLPPRRDLWPAIAEAIRRRPAEIRSPGRRSLRLRWAFAGALAAATAAVLIVLVSGPPGGNRDRIGPAGGPDVSGAPVLAGARGVPPSLDTPAAIYLPSVVRAMETVCMGAGKELLASVRGWENPAGAEAAASVERNIRTIDVAIEETKEALRASPQDPDLIQMLTARYHTKLAMLQHAMRLAGEA